MNTTTSRLRLVAIIVLTLVIVLGATSSAAAFPLAADTESPAHLEPPYGPWGTVTLNGSAAPAGTEIKATIVGRVLGQTNTIDDSGQSWYAVDVPGDDPSTTTKEGGAPGDKVTFVVDGYPTCVSQAWASGSSEQVHLAAITQPDFADVPLTDWGFCSVRRIFENHVTTGCNGGATPLLYCPDGLVTRREMAVFLVRALGETQCTECDQDFADVLPEDWGFGWIERFYQLGLTTGCNGGATPLLYCPDGLVTRREMAVFLVRAMGLTQCNDCPQDFADVLPADWGFGWIERFYQQRITTGCNGGAIPLLYCPDGLVTRREMAVFLERTFYP